MRFAYQRGGAPILSWTNGPPAQSRAADAVSLGAIVLPVPGGPEPINGLGNYISMGGCSCAGTCGCSSSAPAAPALSDIFDSVPGGIFTVGIAAFLAWRLLRKNK